MTLNGVDVSGNQPADICSRIPIDFAFVKATGNPNTNGYKWNYVNPRMEQQAREAYDKTGCLGLYHFAWGTDAKTEADFFCDKIASWVGKAIPVLDYEAPLSNKNNREWARTFIRRVKERTGVAPMIYASSSVISSQNLVGLAKEEGCTIWSANYYAGYKKINGYSYGNLKMAIANSLCWQYTSSGYLSGYNGALDLDVFYGTKEDWQKLASGNGSVAPSVPTTPSKPVSDGSLTASGYWDKSTTIAFQKALGTTADGVISHQYTKDISSINRGGLKSDTWQTDNTLIGSNVIRAWQKKLKAAGLYNGKIDGLMGLNTWQGTERYFGVNVDKVVSGPSTTVKKLQQRLIAGTL